MQQQQWKEDLGDQFEIVTAFSRDGPQKVYVQHRLKAMGKEVNELLEKKAYFYVCGDAANMAREVNTVLAQILTEYRGVTEARAEEIVKNMRASNQYQVRQIRWSPHLQRDKRLTQYTGGCLVIRSELLFYQHFGTQTRNCCIVCIKAVQYTCKNGIQESGWGSPGLVDAQYSFVFCFLFFGKSLDLR